MYIFSILEAALKLNTSSRVLRRIISKNNYPLIIQNNHQCISGDILNKLNYILNRKLYSISEISKILNVSRDRIVFSFKELKPTFYQNKIEIPFSYEEYLKNRTIQKFLNEEDFARIKNYFSQKESLQKSRYSLSEVLKITGFASSSYIPLFCKKHNIEYEKDGKNTGIYTKEVVDQILSVLAKKEELLTYKDLRDAFVENTTSLHPTIDYLGIKPIIIGKRSFYSKDDLGKLKKFYEKHSGESIKQLLYANTCLQRYGKDNFFKVDGFIKKTRAKQAKKRIFEGKYFDSKWEIYYYFYLKDNEIPFDTQIPFEYVDVFGKNHLYFCDFYRKDLDEYIEIKNPKMIDEDGNLIIIYGKSKNESEQAKLKAKTECMKKHEVKIISNISFYEKYFKENATSKIYTYIKNKAS